MLKFVILFALGIFLLWVIYRRSRHSEGSNGSDGGSAHDGGGDGGGNGGGD